MNKFVKNLNKALFFKGLKETESLQKKRKDEKSRVECLYDRLLFHRKMIKKNNSKLPIR